MSNNITSDMLYDAYTHRGDFPTTEITVRISNDTLNCINDIVAQTSNRLTVNAVVAYLIDCGIKNADFSDFYD